MTPQGRVITLPSAPLPRTGGYRVMAGRRELTRLLDEPGAGPDRGLRPGHPALDRRVGPAARRRLDDGLAREPGRAARRLGHAETRLARRPAQPAYRRGLRPDRLHHRVRGGRVPPAGRAQPGRGAARRRPRRVPPEPGRRRRCGPATPGPASCWWSSAAGCRRPSGPSWRWTRSPRCATRRCRRCWWWPATAPGAPRWPTGRPGCRCASPGTSPSGPRWRRCWPAPTSCCAPGPVETFGLAALEALACGTPVVVNAASALPEVVGEAGVAVPGTAEAFADGVRAADGAPGAGAAGGRPGAGRAVRLAAGGRRVPAGARLARAGDRRRADAPAARRRDVAAGGARSVAAGGRPVPRPLARPLGCLAWWPPAWQPGCPQAAAAFAVGLSTGAGRAERGHAQHRVGAWHDPTAERPTSCDP